MVCGSCPTFTPVGRPLAPERHSWWRHGACWEVPRYASRRMKKMLFWHLLQGPTIRNASCYHATSRQEYEDIRAYGLTQPVAIIPNGIDLPQPHESMTGRNSADRVVLSLGRIHPKKGLDRLVRAWAKVEAAHPDWRLRIVGPAELGHDVELRALAATLKLSRVSIEPAIYGEEKYTAFREADVFVLPTLNENFAMTVAESLLRERRSSPRRAPPGRGSKWSAAAGGSTTALSRSRPR